MKDFDKWNDLKKNLDENTINSELYVKQGHVFWCSFGLNVGAEIDGKNELFERPVLVIRNISKDLFLGIPITSKQHNEKWYIPITIREKTSFASIRQMKPISMKRISRKITTINQTELQKVLEAIKSFIFG